MDVTRDCGKGVLLSVGNQVRIGVVGLGSFGTLHAETVQRLAEARLAVLVDANPDRLREAVERWPDVPAHQSLQDAMDDVAVDGWVIATSTSSHLQVARQLLSVGGRVLIEKPLAETSDDAETIAELVDAESCNVMLGHIVLFGTEFRSLVSQARERSPIQFIDAVRHRPKTTMDAFPGESPFHLTMVHDLYCVQVLKERAEPTRMSAQVHRDSGGRIDLAMAQMQWDDGSIASLTASFMTPSGMPADGFDRIEVFGRDWAARAIPNPRPFQLWDDGARRPLTLEIDDDSATGMLAEELRRFCRVVRGEGSVPMGATYADGLQVQRWMERLSRV